MPELLCSRHCGRQSRRQLEICGNRQSRKEKRLPQLAASAALVQGWIQNRRRMHAFQVVYGTQSHLTTFTRKRAKKENESERQAQSQTNTRAIMDTCMWCSHAARQKDEQTGMRTYGMYTQTDQLTLKQGRTLS